MTVTLASPNGTFVGTVANPVTLTNQQLRLADAALVASAGISSGLTVSVDGSDLVTVTRGEFVIDGDEGVAGNGVYRAGIPASVSGTLEARHATNARIDLVVARQYDQSVIGSHPTPGGGAIEIIPGTPSATPAVPTRPLMAVELARINVPAVSGGVASVNSSFRVQARAIGVTSLTAAWKTADETVTSSATLQNDDHLAVTLDPNSRYLISGLLEYTGGSLVGNLKYDFTKPSGATMRVVAAGYPPSDTGMIQTIGSDGTTSVQPLGTFGVSTTISATLSGWLTTGGTGGTLQFRWAQNTSNATGTTVKAGSYLRAERVA